MEMHVFWGLMIPVGFFGFAGMAKSLVKSEWVWSNFYLGIDLSLAAIANGLVNIVDQVHVAEQTPAIAVVLGTKVFYSAICVFVSVGALFVTMGIHQQFEVLDGQPHNHRLRRGLLLGVVSNVLGGVVLASFIIMKLRGQV